MNIRKMSLAMACALAFSIPAAHGATIIVTPTLAPNAFGSPSYAGWVNNSIQGQLTGASTFGTPNQPTQYQAQSNVTASESIVTGFPSWKGQADPGTVFGPQFANELGNRMLFGIMVDGGGSQFAIGDLSFSAVSSDLANVLGFGFGFGAGAYNYSLDYRGFLKGLDGILFTSDDVQDTAGLNTQLVDGLVGRGSGNSLAAYCPGCSTTQQQDAINDAASYWDAFGGGTFTGTYSLGNSTGSGTFNISTSAAVPEPATWAMMLVGFGAIGAAMRRRRQHSTPAYHLA